MSHEVHYLGGIILCRVHYSLTLIVVVSRVSAAMLLIVKGWLKWVKKETLSHSGRCLVCK